MEKGLYLWNNSSNMDGICMGAQDDACDLGRWISKLFKLNKAY